MTGQRQKLAGANMDIDLSSAGDIHWVQQRCPWNEEEGGNTHKCAVKNVSLCTYFRGIEFPDTVLCAYPAGRPERAV